jgi:hypothetical protein
VNVRRDSRLAEIEAEEAGLAVKLDRGWLSPEEVEREQARLAQVREAVGQVALRERQIVSYQARRRIDRKLSNTLRDGITLATGANPRAVNFLTALVRGENPLKAAVAAALSDGSAVDPRQGFRDLRDRLRDVESAARAIGGGKTIAIRARLTEALREVTGLADGTGPPPDDQLGRLQDLSDAVGQAADQLGRFSDELLPERPGIARGRFVHDERWLTWDGTVRSLDAPAAKQALTSAVLRRSADRTLDIAEAAGVTLTEAQLAIIATDAFSRLVEQRRAAGAEQGSVIDIDALVRASINGMLLTNGFDPLPEPEVEVAAATPAAAPAVEEAAPIRRRFVGEGTWGHRAWDLQDRTCSIELGVTLELTLESDGTASLMLGDTTWNRYDGDELVCFANGAAQLYPGTWAPMSGSDSTATIAYGSTEMEFQVPVSGDMPSGTAAATVHTSDNTWETVLGFELREVE